MEEGDQKAVEGGGEAVEEDLSGKEAGEPREGEGESVCREEAVEPGQTGVTGAETEEELAVTETTPGEGDVQSRLQSAGQPTPLEDIQEEEEEEEFDREAVIQELQVLCGLFHTIVPQVSTH